MSMLTPPGMGGKYRITGNQYPRMRRPRSRRRLLLTVVAAVVVIGLIGYGTLQLIDVFGGGDQGKGKGGAAQAAAVKQRDCRAATPSAAAAGAAPASTALPEHGTITVNVYNATARGGLAKDTADQLAARGFKVGTFGNAPPEYDRKVKQPALLVGGKKAAAALKVLSVQVKGTVTQVDSKRSGTTVDLMIGKGFKKLAGEKAAAKALKVLATAAPSPAPSSSNKGCRG